MRLSPFVLGALLVGCTGTRTEEAVEPPETQVVTEDFAGLAEDPNFDPDVTPMADRTAADYAGIYVMEGSVDDSLTLTEAGEWSLMDAQRNELMGGTFEPSIEGVQLRLLRRDGQDLGSSMELPVEWSDEDDSLVLLGQRLVRQP